MTLGQRQRQRQRQGQGQGTNYARGSLSNGQSPEEVAEIICTVVNQPDNRNQFRYPTTSKGKELLSKRYCDPSGIKSIEEQELVIKNLWKSPDDY
jgi:hypothetical protein